MSEEIKAYLNCEKYNSEDIILFFAGSVQWSGYVYSTLIIYDKPSDNVIVQNEEKVGIITINSDDLLKIKELINKNKWLIDENIINKLVKDYNDKYYKNNYDDYALHVYYHKIDDKDLEFRIPDTEDKYNIDYIKELIYMYKDINNIFSKYNVDFNINRT